MTKYLNIRIILAVIAVTLLLGCQRKVHSQEVPKAVKATFNEMYPDEHDPDWHIDSHGYYESHFKVEGVKHRADFLSNGQWIETEVSIKKKELPKAIKEVLKRDYAHEKINEIERVQHHSKGLFYDVEFKRKGKNKDVEFKEDGTIIG